MQFSKKILLLFLLITNLCYGQQPASPLVELQQKHFDYFQLNREYVFLHLNKTQVAPQENIWFSAYVYDLRTNTPNVVTTNLNVALFNEKGQQVASKTVFISQGTGEGWFSLPAKKYTPGKYYIKAATNYMRNFKEDLAFVQAFEIVGNTNKTSETKKQARAYDLQLLPEGGHFVAGVYNTVGVKLINQKGKGVFFINAEVLNNKGDILKSFDSNQFGISKFNIKPSYSENYKVKLKTEFGDTLEVPLPKVEKNGLILKTNNFLADQVIISLETNNETLQSVKNKFFYITYHQQHKFKSIQVSFPNKPILTIPVDRELLFPGINIITVFNEDKKPILERLIYNPLAVKRKSVSAKVSKNLGDSLLIEVKNKSIIDTLQRLSISVLPKQTKSYQPNYNILSAFLLKPYIKSAIENSSYYFNYPDKRKRLYDLDFLLLTQGWSKYDWRNINSFTPKENYENEVGFFISGTINNRNKKSKNLFISSKENQLMELAEINSNDKFELNNLFIKDSSSIHFGLFNRKNNRIIRSEYAVAVMPFKKQLSIEKIQLKDFFNPIENNNLAAICSESFIKTSEMLDTVLLKGTKKTNPKKSIMNDDLTVVDEDMRKRFHYITDYIATQNFRVTRTMGNVSISSGRPSPTLRGSSNTTIILDGVPITDDLSMIADMQTFQVESIRVDRSGFGYGAFGGNGVIEINTRLDYSNEKNENTNLFTFKANNGFATNKKFYTPKYTSYGSDLFLDYGVIHWEPKLQLDKNKNTITFRIPNTLTEKLTLFIEGMTDNGYLIAEEIDMHVK